MNVGCAGHNMRYESGFINRKHSFSTIFSSSCYARLVLYLSWEDTGQIITQSAPQKSHLSSWLKAFSVYFVHIYLYTNRIVSPYASSCTPFHLSSGSFPTLLNDTIYQAIVCGLTLPKCEYACDVCAYIYQQTGK